MPQQLFKEFAQLDQVEAIVLGGSRAGQHFDKDSDYDVYVYLKDSPDSTRYPQQVLLLHGNRQSVLGTRG